VIGFVGSTHQVLIGPAIKVRVLAANETVPSIADFTLAFKHWVTKVAKVDALRGSVAVVGFILAGVFLLAYLKNEKTLFRNYSGTLYSSPIMVNKELSLRLWGTTGNSVVRAFLLIIFLYFVCFSGAHLHIL